MNKLIFSFIFIQSSLLGVGYAYVDAEGLYLQRGGSLKMTLVNQGTTKPFAVVMTSRTLCHDLGYEPSCRFSVGYTGEASGMLLRAFFSEKWQAEETVTGSNLNFPFINPTYAPGYYGAYEVKGKYNNGLTIYDAYFVKPFSQRWQNYFAFQGLAGLQYMDIPDATSLTFYSGFNQANTYSARTYNYLGLGALGFMLQIRPYKRFAMELINYGGIGGNFVNIKTDLKINNNTETLRNIHTTGIGLAFSYMGSLRLIFKPLKNLELGLGYDLMYLGGMAMSYRQMKDRAVNPERIRMGRNIWYQGATFRISLR